ncbi:MAG: glycosyltransferase family 4 protein [Verrucomicrobia bacterium]|nr:glycosyltransferase family 4 protein [Verrucomicrobiota bacterium]
MRILFIAPQPFYEERGTPIAVRNLVETLGGLDHDVDLVAYHLGHDMALPNARTLRIPWNPIRHIGPGFSWKKLPLDLLLQLRCEAEFWSRRYDVVHAVEEGAYMAMLMKYFFYRVPYVMDVDSSIPDQMADKGLPWSVVRPFLQLVDDWAIAASLCVVTMCRALSESTQRRHPKKNVFTIEDPPVLPGGVRSREEARPLRRRLGIGDTEQVVLYMGNFSSYQGVDLLIEAFVEVAATHPRARLLLLGGTGREIAAMRTFAGRLGIDDRIIFAGHVAPQETPPYFALADVLVSPRRTGTNTPMKIYTYMASQRPIVATNLATHTQVLDERSAVLVAPSSSGLARGIGSLLDNAALGQRLAGEAARLVEDNYSMPAYRRKVAEMYAWVEERVRR